MTENNMVSLFLQQRVKGEALSSLSTRQQDSLYFFERRIMDHIACTVYGIRYTDCSMLDLFDEDHDIEEEIRKADGNDMVLDRLMSEYLATAEAFK